VIREQSLDPRQLRRRDIRDDKVLVRGQAKLAFVYVGDLPQGGLEVTTSFVLHTTVSIGKASKMVVAILASSPARVVDVTVKRVWSGRLKLEARESLDLCFK
jgi:hypothetical protein